MLLAILLVLPAYAQPAGWEDSMAAARAAYAAGNYAEAGRGFEAALAEAETFPPGDPRLSASLYQLAELHRALGRYAEAEPLLSRALAVREK